jgi:hypothetical protein
MSYLFKNNDLRGRPTSHCVAINALGAAIWVMAVTATGCASLPPPTASSIDFVDANQREGTLQHLAGRVIVVDVCSSVVAACNVNARVLDEVLVAFPDKPLVAITLLLDEGEMGQMALEAYRADLGVGHDVVLAGPRVRAGTSSLGDTGYVPRVVVIDAEGRIRLDEAGGVIGVVGLVERLRPWVDEAVALQRPAR